MAIYTCTIGQATFGADQKRALAGEIARIHSSMIHVPSTYVNVACHELAADGLYSGGVPASPVLVTTRRSSRLLVMDRHRKLACGSGGAPTRSR